jgi:DinB superfamily
MKENDVLREHLTKLLNWEDAHAGFDKAISGIPENLRGIQPKGLPYSAWQILEHLRLCQWDILDFCRNPNYEELNFEEFWPKSAEPPSPSAWEESVASFRRDRDALQALANDRTIRLFDAIPHGQGQTYLREILLVADHNAYHVADLVAIRRVLGIWK